MNNLLRIITIIFLTFLCFSCEKEESDIPSQNAQQPDGNNDLIASKATRVIEVTTNNSTRDDFYAIVATCGTNYRMSRGVELTVGSYLYTLQNDGNFVCYNLKKGPSNKYSHPIWATNTYGKPVQYIYFQEDGNIVAYDNNLTKVFWSSNSYNKCEPNAFLFDNGELGVIYNDQGDYSYQAKEQMPTIYDENFE